MKRNLAYLVLGLIVLLALVLRVYKIDKVPSSLSWDEAAVGYNAYSIANYGIDEWGVRFPLVFKSFEDYKHPVHIYTTTFFVKLFGLSDFTVRFPAALFGVANVILIFFLAEALFKNRWVSYLSAVFLAVSPYNIQFSRFNHELNFAVFYFMLGLFLFFRGLEKKNYLLSLSFLSFGVSLLSYHSAKIVVPPTICLLVFLYFKKLLSIKKYFLTGLGILGAFGVIFLLNPELSGFARLKQTSFSEEQVENTYLYQKTHNSLLGNVEIVARQYPLHFSHGYLFDHGDSNLRHSIQTVGEFYKLDAPLLILGALFLLWLIVFKKSKQALVVFVWALLAPLPSAAVNEAPHAARAMFTTGSWHIIAALGVGAVLLVIKKPVLKIALLAILLMAYGFSVKQYLVSYYSVYVKSSAIEWQYGMKQVVEYLKGDKDVGAVYMTNIRQQPYIFVLYYLKTPTSQFRQTVNYDTSLSRSFNLVSSFAKYHFLGDLEFAYSYPAYGVYYVLTGPEYTGLYYKKDFEVKKLVKYPDGADAFYIVTAK